LAHRWFLRFDGVGGVWCRPFERRPRADSSIVPCSDRVVGSTHSDQRRAAIAVTITIDIVIK
jgi:hypothetical protein